VLRLEHNGAHRKAEHLQDAALREELHRPEAAGEAGEAHLWATVRLILARV
jgi:hypothetical protein